MPFLCDLFANTTSDQGTIAPYGFISIVVAGDGKEF